MFIDVEIEIMLLQRHKSILLDCIQVFETTVKTTTKRIFHLKRYFALNAPHTK